MTRPAATVIGVDAGSAGVWEADHLLHRLVEGLGLPPGVVGCTHLIRTGRPHVALSFALPDAAAAATAWAALPHALTDLEPPAFGAAFDGAGHGPAELMAAAALAAAEHRAGTSGRAVLYPGVEHLTGTVTLADLSARSPIAATPVLGRPPDAPPPPAATLVLTRDHVRPEWRAGRLVLPLVPAAGGRLAPFEVPNPTPCCADHH